MSTAPQPLIPPVAPEPEAIAPEPSTGWEIPGWRDPRWPFAALLGSYAVLGCLFLGFNRNIYQIGLTVALGALLDMGLTYALKGKKVLPLSAAISCLSLSLILNYSHDYFLLFFPVLLTIGSKYIFTFKGRHTINPSLFGVATSLLFANEWITAAPAYQWGGNLAMSVFLLMAALSMFVFKVGRGALVVSFLSFYAIQTALRAWIMRYHLPPETLFLGTMTTTPFFLFTFYMLTDPATSPKTRKGQIALALVLTLVDLYLHKLESVFTFFYAAFIIATSRLAFNHVRETIRTRGKHLTDALTSVDRWRTVALVVGIVGGYGALYRFVIHPAVAPPPLAFHLDRLGPETTGIRTEMADVLNEVDPRLQHISKWVLSVGDAAAVADFDRDGKLDLFLTNPLKRPEDRNALYRNVGGFRFERVAIPALVAPKDPGAQGLAATAAFADYDNDGDDDLLLGYGYGKSRLLKNTLTETGKATFTDVTTAAGIDDFTISLTANWFDYDRDGKLDMLIGNAVHPYLPGYDKKTPLNIFKLPQPAYPGDRRMFNFMHNGWHDCDNGAANPLYHNLGNGRFERKDPAAMGMPETHWTLAIGTGDLNQDGWTDLYCASDFGHDDLYLNKQGKGFERMQGKMFGDVGLDTYKGMNTTLADFDRNGRLDVYISDVHHALQAEGSILWMNRPGTDAFHPALTDEATQRGALNENRFGWGAMAGDLNNDGWMDILQGNGMVDDRLDKKYPDAYNKDYWYVNHKLMQAGPDIHTYADMWGDLRGRTIYPTEARRLYLNLGDRDRLQFVDVAKEAGVDDPDNSRGVVLADFDDDGDLDVVVTNMHGPVSIYSNTLNDAKGAAHPAWLGLALTGNGVDTSKLPVGTKVEISYTENGKKVVQMQEVQAVNGMASQKDPRLLFGLGGYRGPVDVAVTWYGSGKTQRLTGVNTSRYMAIAEPKAAQK